MNQSFTTHYISNIWVKEESKEDKRGVHKSQSYEFYEQELSIPWSSGLKSYSFLPPKSQKLVVCQATLRPKTQNSTSGSLL
jgi:hypothetical protein